MPAVRAYVDDEFETFPLYVRLAHGQDRSWEAKSHCRGAHGELLQAWHVLASETVVVGESQYRGSDLIKMALKFCQVCPVQWDCARTVIESCHHHTYMWGTWGADISDLRWLKKQGNERALEVIEESRSAAEPVQVTLQTMRRIERRERREALVRSAL